MDRILLWAAQLQGQWRAISAELTQTDTEDDHPILRKEVEAAVQLFNTGKSAGVDNILAELVQADGEDVIAVIDKIWKTGERMANPVDPVVPGHNTSQERQPAAVPELPNDQLHQPPKQSHADDHTDQIETTSGEGHCWRTGRLQSRKEHHRADLQTRILFQK